MKKYLIIFTASIGLLLVGCSKNNINWPTTGLATTINKPNPLVGTIHINNKNKFKLTLTNYSYSEYKNYVKQLKQDNYPLIEEETDNFIHAYNKKDNELKVNYKSSKKELTLTMLKAIPLSSIIWPNTTIGKAIPKPTLLNGYIQSNNNDALSLIIGKLTKDKYTQYINQLIKYGYTKNKNRKENLYQATNKFYTVKIIYHINQTMSVFVTKNKFYSTIRSSFKKAMDSYEAFIKEFTEFMKIYKNSNYSRQALKQYAKYINKYKDVINELNKWKDKHLNQAEIEYYRKVKDRITNQISKYL